MSMPLRAFVLAILISVAAHADAAPPIKVMLLDGESGGPWHKWQLTTPVLKRQLEDTGLFQVDVVTALPAGGDFSTFKPNFGAYRAVVWNYDAPDERWSAELKATFEQYVTSGGGVVIVHAADNAFPGWPAFNEMIGIGGWRNRDEKAGPRWFMQQGKLVSDPSAGPAGSHGRRVPFLVTTQNATHPIVRGLPKTWMHQGDELYASLRDKLLTLPDGLEIYPGHFSGSVCGVGLSGKPTSTIGFEKRWNTMLTRDREAFIEALADVPPKPVEMERVLAYNRGLEEVGTRA